MNLNDEHLIEKQYLDNVINHLDRKIKEYLYRRKEISETIVNYRRKFIEEYRDDDDKVIEYFDHENYGNEKIFNIVEKKIKQLLYLKNSPYFGKIKIEDNESLIEDFYIGSYGFDIGDEVPLIIDWRTPVASLFYQGKLGNFTYTLPSNENVEVNLLERKQFLIKNGSIVSMFNSDIDIKDEFLKEMLSLKSSNRLKSIVKTIQSNQDKIIRLDRNSTVVINGIAGSGKTSIALHRVAYLLYNFRDYFKNRVLILCPNKIFMKYISFVLPSLGEYEGIQSFTGEDFIYLNTYEDLNFSSYETHMEKILNDTVYVEEFKIKGSISVKLELDKFLKHQEENMELSKDIYFNDDLIILGSEINKLFRETFKTRVFGIKVKLIRKKIFDRINKLRNRYVREIICKYENAIIKEDMINYYDMLKRSEIYDLIYEFHKFKSSFNCLNLKSPYELYKDFYESFFCKKLKDLDFSDLILIKYISLRLYGSDRQNEFRLVVIDEAQDFSYMFYEVVRQCTKASSYIIVGDLNQSIIGFEENFVESSAMFNNLNKISLIDSYRSTASIVDYSKKYLIDDICINSIRDGEKVKVVECNFCNVRGIIRDVIHDFDPREDMSIGILVRDKEILYKIYELIKNISYVKLINNEDQVYNNSGIFLTTVYFSKGIEFDYAIVIDNGIENSILYIMLTRAMHGVVHLKMN